MAVTISRLAVQLALDASEMSKGAAVSRKDMNLLRESFASVVTPMEALQAQMNRLAELHRKGAGSAEMHARAAAKLRAEMNQLAEAERKEAAVKSTGGGLGGKISMASGIASQVGLNVPGAEIAAAGSMLGPAGAAAAAAITAIGVAMGGAAIAASKFTNEVVAQVDAIDNLNMIAAEMQVDTAELAPFVAMQNDLRMGTEEIAKTLAIMSRDIGDAATDPAGKTAEQFTRLGLSVEELERKSRIDQFRDVADAIAKIESPSRQAAVAQEIFGRASERMLPAIRQGAAGIDEYAAKSALLARALQKSERIAELDDAIDSLSMTWKSLAANFAVEVAPTVERLVRSLDQVAKSEGPKAITVLELSFKSLVDTMEQAADLFTSLGTSETPWVDESGAQQQLSLLKEIGKLAIESTRSMHGISSPIPKQIEAYQKAMDAIEKASSRRRASRPAGATDQLAAEVKSFRETRETGEAGEKQVESFAKAIAAAQRSGKDASAAIRELNAGIAQLNEASSRKQFVKDMQEAEKAVERVATSLENLLEARSGLSALEQEIAKLSKMPGVNSDDVDRLREEAKFLEFLKQSDEELQRSKEQAERARTLRESAMSPQESALAKLVDLQTELNQLQRDGLMTERDAAKVFGKVRADLAASLQSASSLPDSLEAGSMAAEKAIVAARAREVSSLPKFQSPQPGASSAMVSAAIKVSSLPKFLPAPTVVENFNEQIVDMSDIFRDELPPLVQDVRFNVEAIDLSNLFRDFNEQAIDLSNLFADAIAPPAPPVVENFNEQIVDMSGIFRDEPKGGNDKQDALLEKIVQATEKTAKLAGEQLNAVRKPPIEVEVVEVTFQ